MKDRFICILVSLNPDGTDLSGIEYPEIGNIESEAYEHDTDISRGLYGTRLYNNQSDCEITKWMNTDTEAQWRIVKTHNNDDILFLDKVYDLVKYRQGMVVCSGSKDDCMKYFNQQKVVTGEA